MFSVALMGRKSSLKVVAKTESKRDKFVRLAERRTSVALKSIKLIGNLSNKNNYEYADADAKKILGALTRELDELRRRFESPGGRAVQNFKL